MLKNKRTVTASILSHNHTDLNIYFQRTPCILLDSLVKITLP